MKQIPDSTTVIITDSAPEHINILSQGDNVKGKFLIDGFGTFSFSVKDFGEPKAPVWILTEDEQETLVAVHFGFNPLLLESPSNIFILKCFLTAWTAKRGHPSGYLNTPVPFPLPRDLQQEVSCE